MSDDNTNRDAEPSPASDGSHGEPVGWQATDEFGHPTGFLSWKCGEARWPKSERVPLYIHPQPTLTDEEREAIGLAIMECESMPVALSREAADTLRSLLNRTS